MSNQCAREHFVGSTQAIRLLGFSFNKLYRLADEGVIPSKRTAQGRKYNVSSYLERVKAARVAEDAALQLNIAASALMSGSSFEMPQLSKAQAMLAALSAPLVRSVGTQEDSTK
ncbi:MAG: hypothetical protein WBX25_34835 [Rhodomicrobium sp.]